MFKRKLAGYDLTRADFKYIKKLIGKYIWCYEFDEEDSEYGEKEGCWLCGKITSVEKGDLDSQAKIHMEDVIRSKMYNEFPLSPSTTYWLINPACVYIVFDSKKKLDEFLILWRL